MKKLIAAILIVILITGTACAEALRVAVYTNVPGFGFYNEDSDIWSGMEIDLARYLAEDLGYESVEFIGVDTAGREKVLTSGEADCVIALYTITKERAEHLHFSPAYFSGGNRVMVEISTMFTRLRDLVGMDIGVIKDATAALSLAQTMVRGGLIPAFDESSFDAETFDGGIKFTVYDNYDAMVEALELGENDGICADYNILYAYRNDDRKILNETMNIENYGIATLPDCPLNDRIDALIHDYLLDGTLTTLTQKWSLTEDTKDAED